MRSFMAATSAFVDMSGFFALLAKQDPAHGNAVQWLAQVRSKRLRSITTDYILDETATLLKARGCPELISVFFEFVSPSQALHIEWISPERFHETQNFFVVHRDHEYSFTDCTSFIVMRELGLRESLTTDKHFREAGFVSLLPTA